ncbi:MULTISPECIES: gliding motility-associated protein GldE [Duncaniella]|uniref:gliding motility-associated protein GldE n=1 Tax=Duncaniella TaxID=2518495 RepID=UPI001E55D821|nr:MULTISPECIES: gliding motility-associated protein GldE [Duncaniella]MCX4284162.1 gliding motility-associated protein GldE [Duncaniella dubosii]
MASFLLDIINNPLLSIPAMSTAQIVSLSLAIIALVISGFVSGSEISFFSLTPVQCDELEESSSGERVMRLLRVPERLLATILIINNLVNVTIVVLCNFALGPIFSGMSAVWSFILQTVLLTFLILLFGEILPKLYANSNNLAWAKMAAPVLEAGVKLFYPLSSVLVKSSGIVKKVVTKENTAVTADDLSQALEIAQVTDGDNKDMLEGILKFGDTTASEVMTPRVDVTGLDVDDDFAEVMKVVIESGFARLPVYENSMDNIKGVLYSRDLLPYIGRTKEEFEWQKLMREPYFVPESRMIDDLLEDFRSRRVHLAIVVDEFGGTQGIVTLEDVLEEIVGDIDDEYDVEEKNYRRLPDDTYIFEGKTLLNDFFRVTDLDEDDYSSVTEDCETLAGMLLAIKGDFPKEKESIVYGRCRFLILSIHQHRIVNVRVKVMSEVQPDQMTPSQTV